MSADNWDICPQCRHRDPFSDTETLRTFREDYEQGIMDGKYYVRYNGRCGMCGYNFSHKHDIPLAPFTERKGDPR